MNNFDKIYSLAVAGVQRLIPYKAGKPIEELERELGLTQIIKLASTADVRVPADVRPRSALLRCQGRDRCRGPGSRGHPHGHDRCRGRDRPPSAPPGGSP